MMRLLACATLLLAACRFDLVDPLAGAGADLNVIIAISDDADSARISVTAFFFPGVDARGRPNGVVDEELLVNGRAIAPVRVDSDGNRSYETSWAMDRAAADASPLDIEGPRVEGLEGRPRHTVASIRRESDETVEVSPGQDLVLRIVRSDGSDSRLTEQSWTLVVERKYASSQDGHVSIAADTPVPEAITVPGESLPAGALVARLQSFEHYAPARVGGIWLLNGPPLEYIMRTSVQATLGWDIQRTQGSAVVVPGDGAR